MKVSVGKSEIKGVVKAPSSKSYTIRGLMCAALADGESQVVNPLNSDDTDAAQRVLGQIGVNIAQNGDAWRVKGDNFRQPDADLFCGDSAATVRFMTAICSVVPGRSRLTVGPSLAKRPVEPLVQALRQLGASVSCQGEVSPVVVSGGRLKGGETRLPGDISSQFVSALLLVSPLAEKEVKINLTTPLESNPYVLMTLECLEKFGIKVKHSQDLKEFEISPQAYKPARYVVEGDWSSASYFLALGAMTGEVAVENLNPRSLQGDKVLIDFLKEMGASVKINKNSVTVKKRRIKAIKADLTDCIDLLPTMAVLAAVADGVSEFTSIERARLKESNRVAAVKEGLEKAGVKVREGKDRLTIIGSSPAGAVIDSKNDHRIAMAFGILGTVTGNMTISDAECVTKTNPQFWDTLASVGGKVKYGGK